MLPLLDTHLHLIYPDQVGYAWTDGIPVLAKRAFTIEDYIQLTVDSGVGDRIFMEAAVDDSDYRSEARFVAKLAENPANRIVGIIASCRPESDEGFDAWLEECAGLPVVGYRRVLHVVDDDMSQSSVFRANVRKIGARDMSFDMCFLARQLPLALQLVQSCDNTRFVLDHCGVPDIAGDVLDPWRQHISELAACSNVVCKISGIMAYCAAGAASYETVRPYLEHVLEAFGPDRLIWGSDWPVVNLANGVVDWVAVTRQFLAQLSHDDAEKIAYKNAVSTYHL